MKIALIHKHKSFTKSFKTVFNTYFPSEIIVLDEEELPHNIELVKPDLVLFRINRVNEKSKSKIRLIRKEFQEIPLIIICSDKPENCAEAQGSFQVNKVVYEFENLVEDIIDFIKNEM